MAKAKNKVIAGDHNGKPIGTSVGKVFITTGFMKSVFLDSKTVEAYQLMDEESRKSASSAVTRALVGNFLLPGVGLLAGVSAKSKGIYQVAIQFKDGTKSLIEVDDKIYKLIIKNCF